MSNYETVSGYKLQPIERLRGESNDRIETKNMRLMKKVQDAGIKDLRWNENDMLTSERGAVYSLPGCSFTTQMTIDAKYPNVGR